MRLSEFLNDVGRPIAYYPKLAHFLGSVNAAVLLCQLLYWEGKQDDQDEGWIHKTRDEIEAETGLTRREQETARGVLSKLRPVERDGEVEEVQIVEEKRKGVPPKMHFKLHLGALDDLWDEWRKPPNQKGGNRPIERGGNVPNDSADSAPSSGTDQPNRIGAMRQNIDRSDPETTAQTTPETTREHTHTGAPALPFEAAPPCDGVCVSKVSNPESKREEPAAELTLEDYRAFARAHDSFNAPDAWAATHFDLRDRDELVREWKEGRSPERIEQARAAPPDTRLTYYYAVQCVSSIVAAHGREPLAVVEEYAANGQLADGVREKLLERFGPGREASAS